LDDTIILWETPYKTVWESAIRRYAAGLGGLDTATLYDTISSVSDWYWSDPERHRAGRLDLPQARREIGRMAFARLGRNDFELAEKIADAYSNEREQSGKLAPGAIDTLESLRKRGIRLGLITNGGAGTQRAKIQQFKLAPYFDNILIEGEFGCGKPDERVFRHTLEKLNVPSSAAWMVGNDLEFDISPCRKLGIYSLWVDGRGEGLPAANGVCPDNIIRRISEIPGLL